MQPPNQFGDSTIQDSPYSKLEGNWTEIDKLLIDLLEMVEAMEYLSTKAHMLYSRYQNMVKYVTFGVSSFATTVNIIATYVAGNKNEQRSSVVDALNLTSSIVLTVFTSLTLVLKYDQVAIQFKDATAKFATLNGKLKAILYTTHEARQIMAISPVQFYLNIKKDYDSINEQLPTLPETLLTQYLDKFKGNNATKPIILDGIIDYDPDKDGAV